MPQPLLGQITFNDKHDGATGEFSQLIQTAQASIAESGRWVDEPVYTTVRSTVRIDGIGNTWTFKSDIRNGLSYRFVGDSLLVNIFLSFTATLPTAVATIYIIIPGGFQAVTTGKQQRAYYVAPYVADGSGVITCWLDVTTFLSTDGSATYMRLRRVNGGNFTAGDILILGQIEFEARPVSVAA